MTKPRAELGYANEARSPIEVQLNARVPKETYRAFKLRCLQDGQPLGLTVRRLIEQFLATAGH